MRSKRISIASVAILAVFCLIAAGAIQELESSGESEFSLESVEKNAREKAADIFTKTCASSSCHGGRYPKAKLNLEREVFAKALIDVPSVQVESFRLADTAAPHDSYLMMKIRGDKGIKGSRMPMQAPVLRAEDEAYVSLWIYSVHLIAHKEGARKAEKR